MTTGTQEILAGRRPTAWALTAVSGLTAASVLFGLTGSWRLALTVVFACTAPGWAVAAYVRPWRPSFV